MRILMVGGGSGGHVTPLKAVAKEIFHQDEDVTIAVVTDRRFYAQTKEIFADMPEIAVSQIFAGKLRRYESKSLAWHLLHVPTIAKNLADLFKLVLGTLQMLLRFMRHRPQIVFSKGGFVSVPVCVAARLYKIPLIIHDSDARPGLSSRIASRWALRIATGMPTKFYNYPADRTLYVGMPVSSAYQPVTEKEQLKYKKKFGFDSSPVLLLTGGGIGAQPLNEALGAVAVELLEDGWQIIQITGHGKAEQARALHGRLNSVIQKRWLIEEFTDLVPAILAADVVVSRTGATTMQELANAKKAVITVPGRHLGDQQKNAHIFEVRHAALVLSDENVETNPRILKEAIDIAYAKRTTLASTLNERFAKPNAAKTLASLILSRL